jgi:protein-S-isoprenylcysteine O-methyltransferase Ste14
MARRGFKTWLGRRFPAHLERSLYVGVSGLATLGLALTWQPLPGQAIWHGPWWLEGVAALGIASTLWCSSFFDHADFFGLRQAWHGRVEATQRLYIVGPYRWVRHPLMIGVLLFLWGHPVMSPTLLVLSGGLTLYIFLALPWEERELARTFGEEYEAYRRDVPLLIPWRRPAQRRIIER